MLNIKDIESRMHTRGGLGVNDSTCLLEEIRSLHAALARVEAERDEWHRQCRMASEAQASALSGEADAVRRAESAELGCEIAYRREPTQAEGDAHADGDDECFVSMGGWTGRRCRHCRRWAWGGPTACEACAAFEAGQERAEAAERKYEAARTSAIHWQSVAESRPEITPEDAAVHVDRPWAIYKRIETALRTHAEKAAPTKEGE